MSWWSRVIVVSVWFSLATTALAQSSPPKEPVFINHVVVIANWQSDATTQQSLIDMFKHLLRVHGYQTDDCKETKEAWSEVVKQAEGSVPYEDIEKRLIVAQKCAVPASATHAYSARLVLDLDRPLNKRQAVLSMIPLHDHKRLEGTYAHRDGHPESWYFMMDHVISRAIGGHNVRTAIRIDVPREASVGDTVKLDGSEIWDPDGDAFELLWKVRVKACIGKDRSKPRETHDCPEGYRLDDLEVPDRAGDNGQTRDFTVPMIGDYHVEVHAKIGEREEPVSRYTVRAYPRRSWSFFSRQGLLRVPTSFMSGSDKPELALVQSIGIARRFMHRLGTLGYYEEGHLGLSINHLNQWSTYNFEGKNNASMLAIDIISRVLDRTGHYGLTSSAAYSMGIANAVRGKEERDEWVYMISTYIGAYYAFGENYTTQDSRFCLDFCPSVTVGPTLSFLQNFDAKPRGLTLGIEAQIAIEF